MDTDQLTVHGLHHVTVISGDAQENLDFYTGVMGMRLVKKSINQDSPGTYHLFYADGVGSPGTDLTFFPWPEMQPARPGAGQIMEVSLAVPEGTLDYWKERLHAEEVETDEIEMRFGERTLPFADPHGLRVALVATSDEREFEPWEESPVPAEKQVVGLHAVRLLERELEATEALLVGVMGFEKVGEEEGWHRYGVAGGGSGTFAEVQVDPTAGTGRWGVGSIHHVAWRVPDDETEIALQQRIAHTGLRPTGQIDRFWFRSVYFREPGGALFELATDGPGFTRDEEVGSLGRELILPPWMEKNRATIEANLPTLRGPYEEAG